MRAFSLFIVAVAVFTFAASSLPLANYLAVAGALLLALVAGGLT